MRSTVSAILIALLSTACAHGLQPCKACGKGLVCLEAEQAGGLVSTRCCRHCKADSQCPTVNHCNCDEDACSIHTAQIPFDICVAPAQRATDPESQKLFPQANEQLSCTTCAPNEVCLDVKHSDPPDFRCFRECLYSSDCERGQLCNCGFEKGGTCVDDRPQNLCFVPPEAPPSLLPPPAPPPP